MTCRGTISSENNFEDKDPREKKEKLEKTFKIILIHYFLSNDDISKEKTNKRIISKTKLFIRTYYKAFDTLVTYLQEIK